MDLISAETNNSGHTSLPVNAAKVTHKEPGSCDPCLVSTVT